MICPTYEAPQFLIFSSQTPSLLYYSHLPAVIVSLLIGFFVYLKSRMLVGKILFAISLTFSAWAFLNLIPWTNNSSDSIIFTWSLLGMLYTLIYILSIYFVYVFIDKKDISIKKKIILGLSFLPVVLLTPTKYNLNVFNLDVCGIFEEGKYFTIYYYCVALIIFIWILLLSFFRYRKAEEGFKKQIIYITIGISFFLLSFVVSESLASYLVEAGYMSDFGLQQYGLFGIIIFLGFLAYLIVKFEAFNIKMIGAQVLVLGLVILIGSQFFFIKTFANQILTGITLALAIIFGWALIRSIKIEIERKNELQKMSSSLAFANDKLRKLDNAKSEFISIASHQLRTPLTAIKGFVSLLLEGSYGKISAEVKETLNKVYISNERLIDLVESLLNLSRIESGRMEYKFEKVKLDDVCREIYDTFAIRAKEKNLYLEVKVLGDFLAEVTTDKGKIREVISNLVDNALKYTIKGGVKIKLSDAGEKIRVAVTDTGIGVPDEEVPYLFSKFSRGKDINRLNAGGTGLGLHVGKKMMEALHGTIGVQSDGANMGSTFFIEVPKEVVDEE